MTFNLVGTKYVVLDSVAVSLIKIKKMAVGSIGMGYGLKYVGTLILRELGNIRSRAKWYMLICYGTQND